MAKQKGISIPVLSLNLENFTCWTIQMLLIAFLALLVPEFICKYTHIFQYQRLKDKVQLVKMQESTD